MSKGTQISGPIMDMIRQKATLTDWGYTQIHGALESELRGKGGAPSLSQVTRHVKRFRGIDTSGHWAPLSGGLAPEAARSVMPVLRWLVSMTGGRVWLSTDLARQIGEVLSVMPDTPCDWAWALARAYQAARAREDSDTRCLDFAMASRLWDTDLANEHPLNSTGRVRRACRRLGGNSQQIDDLLQGVDDVSFVNPDNLQGAQMWKWVFSGDGQERVLGSKQTTPVSTPEPIDTAGHS